MKHRIAAFTLVETLVVLAIIVAVFGMLGSNYQRTDLRQQQVKAAAEELAATCRQARALAISRNATFAVVFHIQNHPESTGRVLNNRSGGHWYRILGPSSSVGTYNGNSRQLMNPYNVDNIPAVVGSLGGKGAQILSPPFNLTQMAAGVRNGWAGEEHALPAGKVRFLALTDMDYGDFTSSGTRRVPSATISYPRPWFGWWDQNNVAGGGAGRLYPWGSYDPNIPGSGFYFWGPAVAPATVTVDPKPLTCTNTATRALDRWIEGQQASGSNSNNNFDPPAFPGADVLYQINTPRPLVNGDWRDMCIQFNGSGDVQWGPTMPGRHCSLYTNNNTDYTPMVFRGAAERCNGIFAIRGVVDPHIQAETGNFERDSGGFLITLAPDVQNDQDVFPTAQAALDAMMPLYRVFVSVLGEVRVIPVSRSNPSAGGLKPFPTGEAWWRTGTNMKVYFPQDRLVKGNKLDTGGNGIGDPEPGGPITGFLTTEMLTNRAVWLK